MDDYQGLEAVLLKRSKGSWIVKLTKDPFCGWSGPIGFNVGWWEGGEPGPGRPTIIHVKKWWVRSKIRRR